MTFSENKKDWIHSIDQINGFILSILMVGLSGDFRYWLGRRFVDDKRQVSRWIKIVNKFKSKLVKMIKDANSRFNDYAISPKIRQILLHWGFELTESDLL